MQLQNDGSDEIEYDENGNPIVKDTTDETDTPTEAVKPLSITPLDSQQEDLKKQIKEAGPTGLDYGLSGASQIGGVLQEAMARRRGAITGKDPSMEIANIQKGQERLDQNIQRKENLRSQLQQRLAEREKSFTDEQLKRDELNRKIAKDQQVKPDKTSQLASKFQIDMMNEALSKAGMRTKLLDNSTKADVESAIKSLPSGSSEANRRLRMMLGLEGLEQGAERIEVSKGATQSIPSDQPFDPRKLVKGASDRKAWEGIVGANATFEKTQREIMSDLSGSQELAKSALSPDQNRIVNPVAANAFQRKIAMLFNKGALSENDVTSFSGSQTLWDRFERAAKKSVDSGASLLPQDVKELQQVADALKNVQDKKAATQKQLLYTRANTEVHPGAGDFLKSQSAVAATPSPAQQTTGQAPTQGAKTVVRKQVSPSTGKTKYTYSDGTTEIK